MLKVLVVLALALSVFAAEAVPEHILTNMPGPMADIHTSVHFPPISADKKFHPGDIVDALIALSNLGSGPIHITNVAGALTSPYDPTMYFQNFTDFDYNITLRPDEEWTLHYKFQCDPRVEPRTFGMVLVVFYTDTIANTTHSTTVYNSTFEFSDFADKIDAKTFFTYMGILAAIILVVIFAYKPVMEMISKRSSKPARKEAVAEDSTEDASAWLKGTAAVSRRRSASNSKSRSRSPQKSASPASR